MRSVSRTRAPSGDRPLRRDKKLRPRNRLDIHRNAPPTKRDGALDKRLGVGAKYPQIRYFCLDADIRAEMAAQPLRPDIADPPPEFVLAGLAISGLPVISDGAVKYPPEERDLVEKQALGGVQVGHEIEPGADAEDSRLQFAPRAEWALFPPRRLGGVGV